MSILLDDAAQSVRGVLLEDGTEIRTKRVLSNATPAVTFQQLIPESALPEHFVAELTGFDYTSPVTKINGDESLSI